MVSLAETPPGLAELCPVSLCDAMHVRAQWPSLEYE
jgi:hypothetical protein